VVLLEVARLADTLCVQFSRVMLAISCHLEPPLRVVAVAAHSRRVVVQLHVRALGDVFAVLDDSLLF